MGFSSRRAPLFGENFNRELVIGAEASYRQR
jgi:hypothetical protein